jgi:TolB protein
MTRIIIPLLIVLCYSEYLQSQSNSALNKYGIAYNVYIPDTTKDDWEIIKMNMDGSGKKNITNHNDVAWTYLSYKNRLFFISDRDTCYRCFFLYESDADGRHIKKISDLRLEDSWMSSRNNGEEIIVSGRLSKEIRYQLFILNTRTGSYKQITFDTAARHRDPCFSPDGKKIVFSYQKNKWDKSTHEELYLMNEDGSILKQLSYYPENNLAPHEHGYRAGTPRWHPTENFISYVSNQNGRNSIFAVLPDGTKQWKLFTNPNADGWHDWSPDGNWLVYNGNKLNDRQFHIFLMNWKTKEIFQLTDTTYKSQLGPVFIETN